MVDIVSKSKRSTMMSAIKSRNTKPEIQLRKELYRLGFRFRTNYKKIFGSPDIFVLKHHVAIFVHGCFWHQHANCKLAYTPKSNTSKWKAKFKSNLLRDELVKSTLASQQVKAIIVWECAIRGSYLKMVGKLISTLIHQNQLITEVSFNGTLNALEATSE